MVGAGGDGRAGGAGVRGPGRHASEQPAAEAEAHVTRLEVVEHPGAKQGFVLLPRTWVVERSFAWASRFRRLAKGYERPPRPVAGLHLIAFACLFLHGLSRRLGRVHNTL